jgi:hypothetical protein
MQESQKQVQEINPPLSAEDISRVLDKHGAGGICTQCQNNAWTLVGGDDDRIPTIVLADELGAMTAGRLPVVALVCEVCSHVVLFSRKMILDWLTEEKQ